MLALPRTPIYTSQEHAAQKNWLVLFIVTLASVATNIYLIRITLNLQNELSTTSEQAEQALKLNE